jgi:hypothetical protein
MVNDLNCIIMEAANMSLKLKSPRKTRNSKILNKKWPFIVVDIRLWQSLTPCFYMWLYFNKWRVFWGVRSLFRQPIAPTAHYSDSPLLRQPISPDENSTQLFQNALSSTRIDELIINFNENNYNNIDSMVNDLNCIIMEAANMSCLVEFSSHL